jgi:hypothetical protein
MASYRSGIAIRVFLIGLLTISAAIVAAEVPSREEPREYLLVTRRSYYNPVGERFGGIWQLDPATLEYRRLRP